MPVGANRRSDCNTELRAPRLPRQRACRACAAAEIEQSHRRRRERARTALPRAEVLRHQGCPLAFLEPFREDRLPGGWPRHPSTDPNKHAVDLRAWEGGAYVTLTLTGAVGAGKTMLATELLYRSWLRGRSIWWVRASQLVQRVFRQLEVGG